MISPLLFSTLNMTTFCWTTNPSVQLWQTCSTALRGEKVSRCMPRVWPSARCPWPLSVQCCESTASTRISVMGEKCRWAFDFLKLGIAYEIQFLIEHLFLYLISSVPERQIFASASCLKEFKPRFEFNVSLSHLNNISEAETVSLPHIAF